MSNDDSRVKGAWVSVTGFFFLLISLFTPRGSARLFDERGPHRLLQYDRSISMIEHSRIPLILDQNHG